MSGLIVGGGVVVALVALAGILAAAESALGHMSAARAEGLLPDDNGVAAVVTILERREENLAPLLVLRVAGHVAVAATVASLASTRLDHWGVLAAMVITAVVLYVFAEAIPRAWALRDPGRAVLFAASVVRVVARIVPVRLVTRLLNGIANQILPGPARAPVVSEDEIIALTEAAAQDAEIEPEERDLIESVLAMGDTIVREAMVPRTDMVSVDATQLVGEVLELAIAKGISRIPVCGDGIDDVIGVALLKDLVRAERSGNESAAVRQLMRRPSFVPETKPAADLLREMRTVGRHLAVVIDEYGGTAGLVTLEDLVEELIGEIVDEFDREEPLLEPLAGGEALVHGRMPIDQLSSLVDVELPDDDWDTVGGLIFNTLGHVPLVGEAVDVGGLRLCVERMQGRRITRVRLTPQRDGGTVEVAT